MQPDIALSQAILSRLSRIDRLQGAWAARPGIAEARLEAMREAARIQSVASSSRLAGLKVTDVEVAAVLRGEAPGPKQAGELRGYAAALSTRLTDGQVLLSTTTLRQRVAMILGESGEADWRREPLHREEFDADGRATGRVFTTLPSRLIESKVEELVTWLELELRSHDRHPVLVIGTFVIHLLAVGPFARGNGRLSRILSIRLLQERAGYGSIPFASLDLELERMRDDYYAAMDRAQTRIWTTEADILPWSEFFCEVLDAHRERVEVKIRRERDVLDFPPLQQAILEAVREHGSVDAALLLKATGANRNTLKDNLRRLVRDGMLEKTGQRRGTRYHMAGGEPEISVVSESPG